jgi:hypothetical protein
MRYTAVTGSVVMPVWTDSLRMADAYHQGLVGHD